jgi:hypothetical protein
LNLTASTVTGATNYAWTGPNGFTTNTQNPTITNVTTNMAGIYACWVTGASGLNSATNTTTVTVNTTSSAPGKFSGISVSGTSLTLSVTNGTPLGSWTLLQSTNLTLPLSQWPTNRTGTYDGSGNLSTNIPGAATNPLMFYILK